MSNSYKTEKVKRMSQAGRGVGGALRPIHHGRNAEASRWLGAGRCSVVQRHGRSVAVGAAGAGRGLEWREAEWGGVYQ